MKSRILFASVFAATLVGTLFMAPSATIGQGYIPLEQIPGSAGATTLPDYISGIYKFGIWTVGIAALFMLTIGGFVYMTSGGNTATLSRAKGYISDALIGLVLALLAYLILNVINPDLVHLNLSKFSEAGGTVPEGTPVSTATPSTYTSTAPTGSPWPSDKAERDALKNAGIPINTPNCATIGQKGCTSVYQLPSSTINSLKQFKKDFCTNWTCDLIVSGGTEYWLHKTHGPGKTIVDIRNTATFRSVLEGRNAETKQLIDGGKHPSIKIKCSKNGRRVYEVKLKDMSPMYIWDEDSKHFHADTSNSLC